MLTNYPKLTEVEIGSTLSRPLLVSAIDENTDRNGNTFVKVTLKDGFSDVTAIMFSTSAADLEARLIRRNTVVDAVLTVAEYQGSKSFKVAKLSPATDKSLTVKDFVKLPPVDLDVMYNEIISMLTAVSGKEDAPISDLAIRILEAHKELLHEADPIARLDVTILQNSVIAPIFGITDPRKDHRIDFVGGIRGLSELEKRADSDMKLAFSMYPTTVDDLMAIADAGLIMPPKSTWFEPKLLSGLFVHWLGKF